MLYQWMAKAGGKGADTDDYKDDWSDEYNHDYSDDYNDDYGRRL